MLEWLAGAIESPLYRNIAFTVGVAVAVVSIASARVIARRKQTIELILDSRDNEQMEAGLDVVRRLHTSDDANMRAFATEAKKATDECKAIRYVLNHWEYVSIGIQTGIFDEGMLKRASHATATNLYDHALPFIEAVRANQQRPTIYQEFAWLALRWKEKPLKRRKLVGRL